MPCFAIVVLLFTFSYKTEANSDIAFAEFSKYLKLKELGGDADSRKIKQSKILIYSLLEQIEQKIPIDEPEITLLAHRIEKCHSRTLLPRRVCQKIIADRRQESFDEKRSQEARPFLQTALNYLNLAEEALPCDLEQACYYFRITLNILYGLFAQSYEGRAARWSEVLAMPRKIITILPYMSKTQRQTSISFEKAKKEARFLIDPKDKAPRILQLKDLVGKTSEEIANLDIPSDHPLWYSENNLEKIVKPADAFFRKQKEVLLRLVPEASIQKLGALEFARLQKIVFFKSFPKTHGTHPKIRVQDPYGFIWKLKLGSEFYSEAVANLLYLELGGKYQDLNFAHTYKNPILVIFPKQDPEETITSFATLNQTIKKSYHKEDLLPFMHPYFSHGEITKENIQKISALIDLDPLLTKVLSSQVGQQFAVIINASLEFQDKRLAQNGGPIAQSLLNGENDRALRGLHLFHLFIDNFDTKDTNTQGFLDHQSCYFQTINDLGSGLRGGIQKGLNSFSNTFLKIIHIPQAKMLYHKPLLYRSKAAELASYADLLWMAKKLTKLPNARIIEFVKRSQLPDFYASLLAYKIMTRKQQVAKLFDLENSDQKAQIEDQCFDLASDNAIELVAKRYLIPKDLLKANVHQRFSRFSDAVDCPLIDHKINKDSIIVKWLKKLYFSQSKI